MIEEVPNHALYRYVKSNNGGKFVHIVKGIVSVNGDWINARLMCGNNMGTQKGLRFCVSNEESPCKKCIENKLAKEGIK